MRHLPDDEKLGGEAGVKVVPPTVSASTDSAGLGAALDAVVAAGGLDEKVVGALTALIAAAAAHLDTDASAAVETLLPIRGGTGRAGTVPPERTWSDASVVDTLIAAQEVQGWAEHLSLLATRTLAARAGAELLARADVGTLEEFTSPTRRARWATESRSLAAAEVAAATGWTRYHCHDRVAMATAPPAATAFPLSQLAAGEVTWQHLSTWQRRTSDLPPQVAGAIATQCMDPANAMGNASHQVDPDTGEVLECRLSWKQFEDVLERETVRAHGGPAPAARARRKSDLERRDVHTTMFDLGTGSLSLTGDGPSLAAAAARLDTTARRLRKAGDERTLAQLRADTALALLGFGQLPQTDLSPDGTHEAAASHETDSSHGTTPSHGTAVNGRQLPVGANDPLVESADPDPITAVLLGPDGTGRGSRDPDRVNRMARVLSGVPDAHVDVVIGLDVLTGGPDTVGQVRGYGYITGEHARELITPGTTRHRLVTDPVDGRCIERTTTAYRPDRDTLEQLRAADVTCREPGCTTPWWRCQPDHEHPYDAGGPTSETNLDYKDGPVHWLKTAQLWHTAIEALTRKVTWTTLFGRCYTTSPFDYRPHLSPRSSESPDAGCADAAKQDQTRREMLRQAGYTPMTYDASLARTTARALATLTRDDDGHPTVTLPPTQGTPAGSPPDRTVGQARTVDLAQLLYAALAEHAPSIYDAELTGASWALPVDNAHKHGTRTRRGTPPRHPRYADLLSTRPTGRTRTTSPTKRRDHDPNSEPPPF